MHNLNSALIFKNDLSLKLTLLKIVMKIILFLLEFFVQKSVRARDGIEECLWIDHKNRFITCKNGCGGEWEIKRESLKQYWNIQQKFFNS